MNDVAITAIGIATPSFKRSQQEVAEIMAKALHLSESQRKILHRIYASSGIEQRYSVLSDYAKELGQFDFLPNDALAPFPTTQERMTFYKTHAYPLAREALLNCISQSSRDVKEITHLITVSCTGMYAPGIDVEIVQSLQLNPSVKRTAIQFMGCYGAFNAMKAAESIVKAEPAACVMVVCVELCSLHIQKEFTMDNIISNALFADGAGALLIESQKPQTRGFVFESFYCDIVPQTTQEMSWHISNFGFEMVLTAYVPEAIRTGIFKFCQKLLNEGQLTPQDIDFYAIHPGGIKILEACEEALSLKSEDNRFSYEILRKYGNMSSATIIFVLHAIWQAVRTHDNSKRIFSCAFGPGLTLESMLLRIEENV